VRAPRFAGISLLLALAIGAAAGASARELWEREWTQVRSEHFTLASALSRERSVELAVELENFRAAARLITNVGVFEERIPTHVTVLPKPVRELGFDGTIAGLFTPGMRANYAVIVPSGSPSDEVLKHEYVHFLIHNRDTQLYPPWYDEGFAEVLATLRVKGGVIEYGKPPEWRMDSLAQGSWLPFRRVLEARDTWSFGRDAVAMFYAQSWLLMQYLMIGREGADFAAEAKEFLRRSESGEEPTAAFAAAFGIDPRDLNATLVRYARRLRYYRAQLTRPFPPARVEARRMAPDEIAAQLGLLALLRGETASAQTYYGAALAANPANALALVGSGDLYKLKERWQAAEAMYQRAIALEPEDANHELDYGEYYLTRAQHEQDADARRAHLVEARRHFARSHALDPNNPETLDQNGLSYQFDGEDPVKAVESLEAAHALLPSQWEIQHHLARAYVAAGQLDKARSRLQRLLAWSHPEAVPAIEALLASLEPSAEARASATAAE
jgi:tetratricopeptide (TPR) repeat protein